MKVAWAALIFIPVFAQYPGQYPGQYPPGRYPGGGRYPGDDPTQRQPRTRGPAPERRKSSTEQPLVSTTYGTLRRHSPKQLVIEADDHRIVWYRVTSETAFKKSGATCDPSSWKPGDQISVDSTADDEDRFTAVSVQFEKDGTASDRAAAARAWDLPRLDQPAAAPSRPATKRTQGDEDGPPRIRRADQSGSVEAQNKTNPTAESPAPSTQPEPAPEETAMARPATVMRPADGPRDDDDPGPPVLRRGVPVPRRPARKATAESSNDGPAILTKSEADAPAVAEKPAPPQPEPEQDPLLRKAIDTSEFFAQTLPNFYCNQTTTRYQSDNPKRGWDPLDVVSAEVTYEDGRESYRNIKVNNKSAKGEMHDIGGSTSTGEFESVLRDLFSPSTGAGFRRSGIDTIAGRQAATFKFDVPRERSHWRIEAPSQLFYPAYQGTIWIDTETARVLRLEMQARKMPVKFSFDTVETAVDYDAVKLGAQQSFLLPVASEWLSCQRGSTFCTRNRIEFRNYRKFGAESNVTFDK